MVPGNLFLGKISGGMCMKKYLKALISMFITVSFIMAGCGKDDSVRGDSSGAMSAHLWVVEGRVTEIVEKNLMLISVLRDVSSSKDCSFQEGDTVAVKYDVSEESPLGLDNLEDFEVKPMEVQVGDIVSIMYSRAKKRDIGERKDCNYIISIGSLGIIPEERYESMHSDDADES